MVRRTYDEILYDLNLTSSNYNQDVYVLEYKQLHIKFSNGVTLTGNALKKFRAMFVKGNFKTYYESYDLILNSIDPYSTMVKCVEKVIENNTNNILNREPWNKGMVGLVPWNKGVKGYQVAWNKGLTKTTSESVMKISKSKIGTNNPMYGFRWSDEEKKKQSDRVKNSILNGHFTPQTNNRLSRWKHEWNGIKYRSSWEMVYHKLHPHLEYEKIRIPYEYNGNAHIYITDFVDEDKKIIYEIKPSNLVDDDKVLTKTQYALKWCTDNGYLYKVITEKDEPRMVI